MKGVPCRLPCAMVAMSRHGMGTFKAMPRQTAVLSNLLNREVAQQGHSCCLIAVLGSM
ncbi:hypothetical protein HAX54_009244, partial [Datura stramonium]|nr:hypothetical protein [Datura stramonium]